MLVSAAMITFYNVSMHRSPFRVNVHTLRLTPRRSSGVRRHACLPRMTTSTRTVVICTPGRQILAVSREISVDVGTDPT